MLLVLQIAQYEAVALEVKKLLLVLFWTVFRIMRPGDLYGIIFQNITVAAKSVTGQPEILWGIPEGIIFGLTFDNVVIAGEKVENIDYFVHNEYVFN